jgi:hypothetical protein
MDRKQILAKLEAAWMDFKHSYAGLSELQLTTSRVTGNWSARDILAHVSTWEEEALKGLPIILSGKRLPTYRAQYGGINAFNALMTEQKRALSLAEVFLQLDSTHAQLVAYLLTVPEEQFVRETRFRRRLRLDTYSHYPIHARAIRDWRERSNAHD